MIPNKKIRKKMRVLTLFIITIGLSLSTFNFFTLKSPSGNSKMEDFQDNNLKISSYPQTFENSGDDLNITLHLSYVNKSFDTIVNTSVLNGNNFTLPSPMDMNFNSSYTNFTVEDIFAPNKVLDIEISGSNGIIDLSTTVAGAAHFIANGDGYLENVSVKLTNLDATYNATVQMVLYAYDSGNNRPAGTNQYDEYAILGTFDIPNNTFGIWYTLTEIHQLIDNSQTNDNKWFIGLLDNSVGGGDMWWDYTRDDGNFGGDSLDETDSFTYVGSWSLYQAVTPLTYVDFNVGVELSPLNNTPNPEDIGLKINNENVTGYFNINGSGYWESTLVNGSSNGKLKYNISADWWDVECNITQVQINYTKTDLSASSSFKITGSGLDVEWNVTRDGGLNYFDTGFSDYRINFTIPAIWNDNNIQVFNGTDNRTSTVTKRLLGSGYRDIEVHNAGNGTFWFLNTTSSNLLTSIDTYVGVGAYDTVNYTNIVRFNSTFSEIVKKGKLNLSVYSPSPNYLNHTKILDISALTPDTIFNVTDWDISDNITQYGVFATRMAWSNGTAAGFLIGNLTILGETQLSFYSLPTYTFDASNIFNITAFFNDTGYIGTPTKNITDATISYKINTGNYRTENISNLGNGLYNITFDCNDTDFISNGPNTIRINATRQYYNNQSETINIVIIGETSLSIISPSNGATFDSADTFNITIQYNNTIRDEDINNVIINYSLDGGSTYRWRDVKDIGYNKYNITIMSNNTDFGNYGSANIIVNASKQYYYNQSNLLSITITGNTSLTLSKWPDKLFYYSDEVFNITTNFNDTSRNQGISGATFEVDVDGNPYIITPFYIGNGNYNLTINCSSPVFSSYGSFNIRINASKVYYYNKSDTSLDLIIGNTTLTPINPQDGSVFVTGQIFNITLQYWDVVQDNGIAGAIINYSLNDGISYRGDNVSYIGSGRYNITIYVSHPDFDDFGFENIIINASKQYYNNLSTIITIHRQITTTITPSNNINLGSVIRGLNISYTFNYSDTNPNPIKQATWELVSNSFNFVPFLKNYGDGNYTMFLNTTNVDVSGSPYVYIFNISSTGNETQVISLTIDVIIIQTKIVDVAWTPIIARHSGFNQTITFYFNDTTNNKPVKDVITGDVIIRNFETGSVWNTGDFNWLLINSWNNGTYTLDVSTNGLDAGLYTLEIVISNSPNYDLDTVYITFYLRGNYANISLISIDDPGGSLTPLGPSNNFSYFVNSNLDFNFNLTEAEFGDIIVLGDADYYIIRYVNLDNSSINGFLSHSFIFVYDIPTFGTHQGFLNTSQLLPGSYSIEMLLVKKNYENSTITFYLTVKEKFSVNISIYDITDEITAGEEFNIALNVSIIRNSPTDPLVGASVSITSIINGIPDITLIGITNSSGIAVFQFTIPLDATNLTLQVSLDSEYNIQGLSIDFTGYSVNPPLATGIPFEVILTYIIIIGAVLAIGGGSLGVYKGVIVPKKRAKARVLAEVKTLFDDAINLEHVLIIYKGTGTCVFFKSFGSEQIDPDLISGFITAICSFGKDLVWQEELNEISYGEKMLLLTDGEHIRVALVLGKKASLILRKNLKKFISIFEETYANELPNWRGQLDLFRSAGTLIDEMLNTSIILPHEITYEFSSMKALKKPHSREVLKIAEQLMKETDRNFFFIATLLNEAAEKTNKDTAEIFMGIKELRDQKILMPIDITTLEAPTISQQELNLIEQKISTLENILPEEKQKLVNDLAQLGPAEREAYFSSMEEQKKIISAPIDSPLEVAEIENVKKAKKQIKILQKKASSAKKEKNYDGCIKIYQNAAKLATEWELHKEFHELDEIIRTTKIEDLRIKKKAFEKDAKEAVKVEDYNEASQKYRIASKIASEIFKLGGVDMTKEVKRLSNKSKEYEKLI